MGKFIGKQIVATSNAAETLDETDINMALERHFDGDWGESLDKDINDAALASGEERVMGVYKDKHGATFWIITEWDKSVTTVLMPEDY